MKMEEKRSFSSLVPYQSRTCTDEGTILKIYKSFSVSPNMTFGKVADLWENRRSLRREAYSHMPSLKNGDRK